MTRLSREIVIYVTREFWTAELLRRLSDPFWFQAFGCVRGFDWHSSGVTTTVCGVVKEGLRGIGRDLWSFAAGGKGGTPFPVDRETYDRTIEIMGKALNSASVDRSEKVAAFRRLGAWRDGALFPDTGR